MSRSELIESFDVKRLSKSNSFFDRKKLLSFNTEHIKMSDIEELVVHFRSYLDFVKSPVREGDDSVLARILSASMGSRTLADIEQKSRFAFLRDDEIEFDAKAVKKVLRKAGALDVLAEVGEGLKGLDELTAESIESMLRGLAERKEVGLGKVAQPLRVAVSGSTVSLPIFDAVDMLGLDRTISRIKRTIEKFREAN
jgi:glutamyl-tRNA synthetase